MLIAIVPECAEQPTPPRGGGAAGSPLYVALTSKVTRAGAAERALCAEAATPPSAGGAGQSLKG